MILLEPTNKIIQETLNYRFESNEMEGGPAVLDVSLADYDGVTYHITTPLEDKNVVQLSMRLKCFQDELVHYGAWDVLQREFGDWLLDPSQVESGFDVSLQVNLAQLGSQQDRDEAVRKLSSLKTLVMAAPFEKAFEQQLSGKLTQKQDGELMKISYRDDEAIYIKASFDRVTVIFSTLFKDETDVNFGKVFLQEFVDCRKQANLQNAPQALYTNRDPPLELRGLVKEIDNMGYVTFVLNPRHYQTAQSKINTISLIQYFRNYLHYHIKCSKAYMHSRMRAKVDQFLKVLNRAKPEVVDKEKKTASGKTFVRK